MALLQLLLENVDPKVMSTRFHTPCNLPTSLIACIFDYLSVNELMQTEAVSKHWVLFLLQQTADFVWRKIYIAEEWLPVDRDPTRAWRDKVRHRCQIESSLIKGRWITSTLCHGSPISALSLNKNLLATAGNKDLKVWNLQQKSFLRVYKGHSCRIFSVHASDSYIVTGGEDHWIKIWSTTNSECLRTLYGHGEILCLTVGEDNSKIVSGYYDGKIRVYDLETSRYIHNLAAHKGGVKGVKITANRLYSGSYDHFLKEWDLRSGVAVKTFQGHISSVEAIDGNEKRLISGSMNHTIRVWNSETAQCLNTLNGHTDTVSAVSLHGKRIISGSYDHKIKVWDAVSGKCLQTLLSNSHVIEAVGSDSTRVVAGDWAGQILIWEAPEEMSYRNKRDCSALQFWE